MTEESSPSKKNLISQQAFNKLLEWFNPDRDKAALKHEQIRLHLIRFFQFNDCPYSEDCADDVIQRVAQKLVEGVEVKATDPYVYFRAVARNTLLEYWKDKQRRQYIPIDNMPLSLQPSVNPDEVSLQQQLLQDKERAIDCLPKCLGELPSESSQLFLRYHQSDNHISSRMELAKELGLEINALRSRITRIRDKLEKCIQQCLQK